MLYVNDVLVVSLSEVVVVVRQLQFGQQLFLPNRFFYFPPPPPLFPTDSSKGTLQAGCPVTGQPACRVPGLVARP